MYGYVSTHVYLIIIKMNYKLDAQNAVTLQICNDTFWYLYQEEEMIDEDNMEEAQEVMSMFPNGFIIKDNFKVVDDEPDLIECTFVPYVQDIDIVWDGEHVIHNSKGIRSDVFLFKIINHNRCYIRWMDERDGRIFREGEYDVVYFGGNPWCQIPQKDQNRKQCSLIPMWGKQAKYFTKNRF